MSRQQPIPGVTGLRFLLAMAVVVNHGAPMVDARALPTPWWRLATLADNVVKTSFITVDGFFILSGFVLAYSYLSASGSLTVSRRTFYVARVARILPAYLLALAASVLFDVAFQHNGVDSVALVRTLTFTQAWWHPAVFRYNPPGWTLSVEAVFYVTFPFLAVPIGRLRCEALLAALPLLWLVMLAADALYDRVWPFDEPTRSLVYHPVNFIPAFLMGVVLGRLYTMRLGERTGARAARPSGRPDRLLFVAGAALALTMLTAPWRDGMVYHGYLLPLWCLIIYRLATTGTAIACLLSCRTMLLLGEASFTVYLLHSPLQALVRHGPLRARIGDDHLPLPAFIVWSVLVVGISLVVYLRVERPARRAIIRTLSGRGAASVAVPAPVSSRA